MVPTPVAVLGGLRLLLLWRHVAALWIMGIQWPFLQLNRWWLRCYSCVHVHNNKQCLPRLTKHPNYVKASGTEILRPPPCTLRYSSSLFLPSPHFFASLSRAPPSLSTQLTLKLVQLCYHNIFARSVQLERSVEKVICSLSPSMT
jgi:hypothetical protein